MSLLTSYLFTPAATNVIVERRTVIIYFIRTKLFLSFMTMPLGWKNNSTRMTLAEYLTSRKDQSEKNFDSLEIELKLALAALSSYQEAEQLDGGGPPPYTPTGYNFVTGEQMIEIQVKERQETMRKSEIGCLRCR
jgi:hypothetical protein